MTGVLASSNQMITHHKKTKMHVTMIDSVTMLKLLGVNFKLSSSLNWW